MEGMTWVKSDPEHIFALRQMDRFMEGHSGFIAGGCFKNVFNGEPVKDVDVFFETEDDFYDAVDYFHNHDDYKPAYESKNVTAFKHIASGIYVELVQSVFGSPEKILGLFDFTVTKFAYHKEAESDPEGGLLCVYKALYHPHFFEHLHLKKLVIDDKIPKPMSTFDRVLRYRKYGYIPCTDTKLKLINAIRELPATDILVQANFYDGID